jgi:hypothetical protein
MRLTIPLGLPGARAGTGWSSIASRKAGSSLKPTWRGRAQASAGDVLSVQKACHGQ